MRIAPAFLAWLCLRLVPALAYDATTDLTIGALPSSGGSAHAAIVDPSVGGDMLLSVDLSIFPEDAGVEILYGDFAVSGPAFPELISFLFAGSYGQNPHEGGHPPILGSRLPFHFDTVTRPPTHGAPAGLFASMVFLLPPDPPPGTYTFTALGRAAYFLPDDSGWFNITQSVSATLTVLPEPATVSLLLLGVGFLPPPRRRPRRMGEKGDESGMGQEAGQL